MKREIQVCDRCGAQAESLEDKKAMALMRVVIGREIRYDSYSHNSVYPAFRSWEAEWCMKCCDALHVGEILRDDRNKTASVAVPPPTLEEMVREIVRQELPGGQ